MSKFDKIGDWFLNKYWDSGKAPTEGLLAVLNKYLDYEKIIKNLKERNKNISIVPIIENSLRKKNEYTTIIEDIGKDNDIKVLDMATVFTKDPAPYAKLTTKGGIYPNNVGYSLYFSNIKSLIEANIAALN